MRAIAKELRTPWCWPVSLPVIVAAVPASAADDSAAECQSQDTERRIAGCTDLPSQPGLHPEAAAAAYSLRALAYQVKGLNEAALCH